MAKVKSKYVCQNCGYETAGYLGKCPECGSWASFVEEILGEDNPKKVTGVKIMPRNIFILDQSMQEAIIMNLKNVYNSLDYEFWIFIHRLIILDNAHDSKYNLDQE